MIEESRKQLVTQRINIEYYFIFIITSILFVIGIIMVSTSSIAVGERYFNDPYWFIRRQLIWCVISFIFFIVFSKVNYQFYSKVSNFIIVIAIVLLGLVLIPGFSLEVGGSRRWLELGFFSIQPSEFVKIAVVIYLAENLNRRYRNIYKIKDVVYPSFLVLFLITLLIFLEPDLGITVVIWVTVFIMLFIGGVKFKHILGLGFMWIIVTVGYLFMEEYRRERIFAFINNEENLNPTNFQITQSLIALGSGGISGLGLGNSIQKYSYLPEAHTDFIFAIIGEELGLTGTIFIVILYLFFAFFGIRVCLKTENYFGRVMAIGFTSLITIQALVNMSVVTGILPVTGLTLPFISFGGSSLVSCMIIAGILLNISKNSKFQVKEDSNEGEVDIGHNAG